MFSLKNSPCYFYSNFQWIMQEYSFHHDGSVVKIRYSESFCSAQAFPLRSQVSLRKDGLGFLFSLLGTMSANFSPQWRHLG